MGLFYEDYGDVSQPLIVFLHGGGVSSWMWEQQVEYLQHYHCVTVDLPEHGNGNHSVPFSIGESAEMVIELIEKIAKGRQVAVVGFSLGAQVLVQMMSMHPHLIDYSIINSVAVRPSSLMKMSIVPMVKLSMPLVKFKWFARLQAKQLYITDDMFEKYFDETRQMSSETLINVLQENMSFSIPDGFSEASGRILVTVGGREKGMMRKSVKDIVGVNENVTAVKIPGIGHGLPTAKPNLMNQIIENWVSDKPLPEGCLVIR